MIRALLILVDPSRTWERIRIDQRSVAKLTLMLILPLLLLGVGIETAGIMGLGVERGEIQNTLFKVPAVLAIKYQAVQWGFTLLIIYGGAALLKPIGLSFHRRHTYRECFTTMAYVVSPLCLMRIPDALPAVNTWICYGIGAFLSVSQLYRAIPSILRPDPSNALGLFTLCAVLVLPTTGLAHFLSTLVLAEKILA